MSEDFKRYTPEEASKEAELMQQKIALDETLSYADAEEKIELEKVIRSAENGTTANYLRTLDLSTEEGIEKLEKSLTILHRAKSKQKIIDDDGRELLPRGGGVSTFEANAGYILEIFNRDLMDALKNANFHDKSNWYGHGITKAIYRCLDLSRSGQYKEKWFNSFEGADNFLTAIGVMAHFAVSALNGGLPGNFVSMWGHKMYVKKELSEDSVAAHPNYPSILELIQTVDNFFYTFREVFTKYLSHQIQDPNFEISHENPHVSAEEIVSEHMQLIRFVINANYQRKREELTKTVLGESVLSQEVEDETRMFIDTITKYQKVLDEYNQRLEYAKPQTGERAIDS